MKKENLGSVKALKKQLGAAVAMVCVAAVALGSSTYAWFVSNNSVKATTTNISAQSNSAYLVIDTKTTSTTSTSSATAAEEVGDGKTYADKAIYPAQWANGFDASKTTTGEKIYQFETAYASDKTKADEKTDTRFAVGAPDVAVTADYALKNQFYIGTGTYDGEFTNLKVDSLVVNTAQVADTNYDLTTALRALVYIDQNNWAVVSNTGVLQSCLGGTITNSSDQSKDNLGIIRTAKFGKTEGDVNVKIYVYYDGADDKVFTDNLADLQNEVGATVTFSATAEEHK